MKKRYILKLAAIAAVITLSTASLSGCGKYNSSNVPGSNAGDAGSNFEGNTDITAGIENADTTYSCEAELGEDKVSATVDALASSIKTKDFSNVAALKDKSDKALNEARIPYLMDSYSEDEAAAEQDIADLYSDPAPTDSQFAEIKKYYDDLAKVFTQFGITYYDFTNPYINNTENPDNAFLEFDVYTEDHRLFSIDFNFNGDKISTIDIYEDYDLPNSNATATAAAELLTETATEASSEAASETN